MLVFRKICVRTKWMNPNDGREDLYLVGENQHMLKNFQNSARTIAP